MKTLLDSYQTYFRDIWPILRDMSKRGIPISEERRMELKAMIEREDARVTEEIKKIVPEEVLSTKQKNGLKRAPKNTDGLVEIEVTTQKEEKCTCLKKNRATCPVCNGTGIVSVGTVLKRWAAPTAFNPNSKPQVIRFMKFMKHPVPKSAKKIDAEGNASDTTEVKDIERLFTKTKHPIYPLLIQKRQLTKVDGTYCEGWKPGRDGRIHSTFSFGTATWQTASKNPNAQNGIARGKTEMQQRLCDAFNKMQAAEPGHKIINFDYRAFHVLTTGLEAESYQYMRLARLDMHSFLASEFLYGSGDKTLKSADTLFNLSDTELGDYLKWFKKDEKRKYIRDKQAKPTILGVGFGLGVRKLFDMNREYFDNMGQVQALRNQLETLFPEVFAWQKRIKAKAAEEGRLVSRYGAVRQFFDVTHYDRRQQKWVAGDQAEQAVAFLPANHAFGHIRWCLLNIRAKGYDSKYEFINTVHDSFKAHPLDELVEECVSNVTEEMMRPSTILKHPTLCPNGLSVDVESAVGESNYDLH